MSRKTLLPRQHTGIYPIYKLTINAGCLWCSEQCHTLYQNRRRRIAPLPPLSLWASFHLFIVLVCELWNTTCELVTWYRASSTYALYYLAHKSLCGSTSWSLLIIWDTIPLIPQVQSDRSLGHSFSLITFLATGHDPATCLSTHPCGTRGYK